MDDTKVGSNCKKQSHPDDVAKGGISALFAGEDDVYAHSTATKLEDAVAKLCSRFGESIDARRAGQAAQQRVVSPSRVTKEESHGTCKWRKVKRGEGATS